MPRGISPAQSISRSASLWRESTKLTKMPPVVLVCNTGVRSSQAALYLASMGYEQIYNLEEGTKGWMQKGFAVDRA